MKKFLGIMCSVGMTLTLLVGMGCRATTSGEGVISTPPQETVTTDIVGTNIKKEESKQIEEEVGAGTSGTIDQTSLYQVILGDTLWDISSSGQGFSDPWYWPAIFRENRDIIEDPDLIYPGEELTIPKSLTDSEKKKVKIMAENTPPNPNRLTPRPVEELQDYLD